MVAMAGRSSSKSVPICQLCLVLLLACSCVWPNRSNVGMVTGLSTPTTTKTTKSTKALRQSPKKKQKKQHTNIDSNNDNDNSKIVKSYSSLVGELQRCVTPDAVLRNVACHVTPQVDPYGILSSLILVRLAKQSMSFCNRHETWLLGNNPNNNRHVQEWDETVLSSIATTLAEAQWRTTTTTSSATPLEAAVEGTKAASLLSRLNPSTISLNTWESLLSSWGQRSQNRDGDDDDSTLVHHYLESHHLSGLQWAWDGFQLVLRQQELQSNQHGTTATTRRCLEGGLPFNLKQAHDALNLPFYIRPGQFGTLNDLNVNSFVNQVKFQVDEIKTTSSNEVVTERRQTAWQGEDHVEPFAYSGKSMERMSWSPLVRQIRDGLASRGKSRGEEAIPPPLNTSTATASTRWTPSQCYYDGCLLNLYPDGGSGMRYHFDPDQGTLWDYETAVVSVGASRRVAFREIQSSPTTPSSSSTTTKPKQLGDKQSTKTTTAVTNRPSKPHTFVVLHGDVMEMFGNCQSTYQHTVKTAEDKSEVTSRVSLVFKKTKTTIPLEGSISKSSPEE